VAVWWSRVKFRTSKVELGKLLRTAEMAGFLRVIGFHSCVTMETLLISLSIEGCYVWSRNTVLCDAFMASIKDAFWDFVPCSSGLNPLFGERIVYIFFDHSWKVVLSTHYTVLTSRK
jgi:hypothetical protein